MPSRKALKDSELEALLEEEERLGEAFREVSQLPDRIERERIEHERTIPPMQDLLDRERLRLHEEQINTRGAVRNHHIAQGRSLLLFVLFASASVALVLWGLRLMQG